MTTRKWMILVIAAMLLSGFTGYGWGAAADVNDADCTCTVEIPPCVCECLITGDGYANGYEEGYAQGKQDAAAECESSDPTEVEIKVQPASKNAVSVSGGNEAWLAGYTRRLTQRWGVGASVLFDTRRDVILRGDRCWYGCGPTRVERDRELLLLGVTYWF